MKRELICCRCGFSTRDERRPCAFMGDSWPRHNFKDNLENFPDRKPKKQVSLSPDHLWNIAYESRRNNRK